MSYQWATAILAVWSLIAQEQKGPGMFFSRFFKRQNPQKQRTLTEKVDHIEEVVVALEGTLDKMHADMWSQLADLREQGAQRPGIVLGLPTQDGKMSISGFEPLPPDEDFEPFSDFEEVAE
jgi:hypothetical protein